MKKVSDWKQVINPVISYTLDSQLVEGITYLECSALGVSLDSGPTEGAPCLEPLEQSVLSSSLAARPVEGVTEKVSDRKPVINPVQNINPYGRPMLVVSPEIRTDQTDGLKCPSWTTQLYCEQSGLQSSARTLSKTEIVDHCDGPDRLQTEISATSTEMTGGGPPADIDICDGPDRLQTEISATSMEMTGGSPPAEIRSSKSPDRLQTEISVMSTEMVGGSPSAHIDICEGPDRLQTEVSVTSTEMAGGSPPALIDICEGPDRLQTEISVTFHVNDDMKTDLPESLAPMLRSPTIFERPCVVSSALPTLNQRIVNLTDVTMDIDADPPESSALMINSDLMVVVWEDIFLWPAKIWRPGLA